MPSLFDGSKHPSVFSIHSCGQLKITRVHYGLQPKHAGVALLDKFARPHWSTSGQWRRNEVRAPCVRSEHRANSVEEAAQILENLPGILYDVFNGARSITIISLTVDSG